MRNISKFRILLFAVAIIAMTIAVGCASTSLRTEATTSGIRAAEELGASSVPQASLHLQFAKEELERAQALNRNGDEEKAKSMLMCAEADAELAIALSHGDAEKAEATKAMERVRQLRQDNP